MSAANTAGNNFPLGLIGANIMKSLAPAMHEAALQAAGLGGAYRLMDLERLPGSDLPGLLRQVRADGYAGVNITYPCKEQVIELLDGVSAEARQVGAVNTVIFGEGGRTSGHNTDRIGFRLGFEETFGGDAARDRKVVLVGAGGAGRAVAFALMDLAAAELLVHDIDAERARRLTGDIARHYGAGHARPIVDVAAAMSQADIVVNATPIGMLGISGNPIPVEGLRARHLAADVIYTPLETEFIRAARSCGARVMTGAGMCVHQAVAAFRLFTGREADTELMRRTFLQALAARDAALSPAA